MVHRSIGAAILLLTLGCDKANEVPPAAQAPATTAEATGTTTQGLDSTAQPSLGGAKRAAHGTVDQIEQRNRELEKQIEEDP